MFCSFLSAEYLDKCVISMSQFQRLSFAFFRGSTYTRQFPLKILDNACLWLARVVGLRPRLSSRVAGERGCCGRALTSRTHSYRSVQASVTVATEPAALCHTGLPPVTGSWEKDCNPSHPSSRHTPIGLWVNTPPPTHPTSPPPPSPFLFPSFSTSLFL